MVRAILHFLIAVRAADGMDFRGTAVAFARGRGPSNFQYRERIMSLSTVVPNTTDDEVLTVKEVSEILNLNPKTVYKLARGGKIPAFRIGSDWRFPSDQVVRWISEQ
jgi:excisionase family DNA binding protein